MICLKLSSKRNFNLFKVQGGRKELSFEEIGNLFLRKIITKWNERCTENTTSKFSLTQTISTNEKASSFERFCDGVRLKFGTVDD